MKKLQKARLETALVKINSQLYQQMREYVKLHKLEHPSIKNFVEHAIMRSLGFKKYNVDGVDYDKIANRPLSEVVGEKSDNLVLCVICNRVFFKDRANLGVTKRICPNCKAALLHFSDKLK